MEVARELKFLREIYLRAVEADSECTARLSALEDALYGTDRQDPEAAFALLSQRGRRRVRDAVTRYALEVTDLCATLAPVALGHAQTLAAVTPDGAESILVELQPGERDTLLEPIFAEAGLQDRLRPRRKLSRL